MARALVDAARTGPPTARARADASVLAHALTKGLPILYADVNLGTVVNPLL